MAPFHAAKTKVQLKLTAQRCQMLQGKKEALAKTARKEIAGLVERGKLETARIKTEGLIGDDIALELLEIMELYTEMLIARFALLEMNTREPDPAIKEPLAAIIHAAPRIELREMHQLREMLMQKYGRDFAVAAMENTDGSVSERVTSRLRIETPGRDLVDMYIAEICKAYNVPFHSAQANEDLVVEGVPPEPEVKPHAAADGPLPAVPLSSEASASTKGDMNIATATGTIAPENTTSKAAQEGKTESFGSAAPRNVQAGNARPSTDTASTAASSLAPPPSATGAPDGRKSAEEQRYDDLEARFAALKRK